MKHIISKYDDIGEALGILIISSVIIGLAPLTIYLAWVSF